MAGAAIIAWADERSAGDSNIFGQRVSSTGSAVWAADGITISAAAGRQGSPQMIGHGIGGGIITWEDRRSGIDDDIFAQRVPSNGSVLWAQDGITICAATGDQTYTQIAADGAAGALITWEDHRHGSADIYAQRVLSDSTVVWGASGIEVCTATEAQEFPRIVGDGALGSIITWQDYRNSGDYDIYAQRVVNLGRRIYLPLTMKNY